MSKHSAIGVCVLAGALLGLSGQLHAAPSNDGVWQDASEKRIALTAQARPIVPLRYRTLRLDRAALDRVLAKVPAESASKLAASPARFELPRADGSYARFRIVESAMMAPELAKKYPQIRTFVGQGIDDPSATLRMDITPKGLHAQVISWQGTRYVDPYQTGDSEHYIAYRKNDLAPREAMHCAVDGAKISHTDVADPSKRGVAVHLATGDQLRTYRLAMAATGEYTAFHGGSVVDALSGIVTTVNRVNGIYEREVGVRFQLVADEDQIIFTDAGSDPYSNSSGDLGNNQSTINSVIGAANYDVGHLVGTGGGGIAGLGVICSNAKARGLTGSGSPVGDAFDVDYVAHEMGHQFGGNHTFNGSGPNCGGNRASSAAYEPGSGVTIQAYAGICGGDNLQRHSEDFFHRISLNEIHDHITAGSGSTCGVSMPTGNTPPTVSTDAAHNIPANTPFALTAVGSDVDGDVLTYSWEQFDRGPANAEGVLIDDGQRPLFRAFAPSLSATRIFPSLRYILDNANAVPATAPVEGSSSPDFMTGELLPSTARTMHFLVTVRDNRAAGGGTNEAATTVNVVNTAGPFVVTTPNTAVTWVAGSAHTVNWDVANTNLAPISTANVRIELSLDGGHSWPIELAANETNDGSASVSVPANLPTSSMARVRVSAVGNIYFDISDTNFSITGSNSAPSITVTNSLATAQGAPPVNDVVATVSDADDAAGSLAIAVSGVPEGLDVSASNSAGSISLQAQAACDLVAPSSGSRAYPLTLTVSDNDGHSASAAVNVHVSANHRPSLGDYSDQRIGRSANRVVTPASPISDDEGNLTASVLNPTSLPGGGTLSLAANGQVTVNTTAGTNYGDYPIRVTAEDSCGATRVQQFLLSVLPNDPVITLESSTVPSGNGLIEPAECNQLELVLHNAGLTTATNVNATVSTSTPDISIHQATSSFNAITVDNSETNLTPIEISSAASASCFTEATLNINVTWNENGSPYSSSFNLPIGLPSDGNYQFVNSNGASIPPGGVLLSGSAGDDVVATLPVPAGFDFRIYDTQVAGGTNLQVSSNGNLQIVASGGSRAYENGSLPSDGVDAYNEPFATSAPVLMPYWDDLRTDMAGGGIYTQLLGTAPNRQWIIEWRGATWANPPTSINTVFAVVLHEGSSDFDYIYGQLDGTPVNGGSATIGLQVASSGNLFTTYAVNQANAVSAGTQLSAQQMPAQCTIGPGDCNLAPPPIFANGFEG